MNVHAGSTYPEVLANLERYALAVKREVSPDEPLGVGLWLSARAATALAKGRAADELSDWLAQRGLLPFTCNGFPYGDFHRQTVKHTVYTPDWRSERRLHYTLNLASVLAALLPRGAEGSLSTLPVGWRSAVDSDACGLARAVRHLLKVVNGLEALEERTGTWVHVDLEPEPGCWLDRAADVVRLFHDHLFPAGGESRVARYLQVCHDVCHSAVMFEDQAAALATYRTAGVGVGKVQVSSAIRICFEALGEAERRAALDELRGFKEPTYLHQTVVQQEAGGATVFYDDLPAALAAHRAGRPAGEWRVHFHVPLFLASYGRLGTTQDDILACLDSLEPGQDVRHFEIETYAWGVLPPELQGRDLAQGIAREILWLADCALARQARLKEPAKGVS
ncbi:MAG TPA: metabolite traffic protein EboE [Thermoanaerobaculia bacterium]